MDKPDYLRVPLASNGLRAEDIASAVEVFNSGQLTMGNRVKDFEFAMSSYLGTKEFVMMNSGSFVKPLRLIALHDLRML